MTHSALIRVAPLHTLERHNDPRWNRPGRNLYEAGSLRFAPGVDEVPLLIDHLDERRVGTVHSLFVHQEIDGPWMVASATVDDMPAWLRKHETRASFGLATYQRRSFGEGDLIARALVSEVSVLSPSKTPAEPLAQVVWLGPTEKPKPKAAVIRHPVPVARGIRPDEEIEEFRRRVDWYGSDVPVELILENMRAELRAIRWR